ncbi:MAG: response regulator [Bryobacterales bacterium]|nr:response regulator [Bryobacterales bacterium]
MVLESAEVENWTEVILQIERAQPDVILLDVSAVGDSLSDVVRRIRSTAVAPLVVAMHVTSDTQIILDAMRAGASEFLFPPFDTTPPIGFAAAGRGTGAVEVSAP